MPKYIYTAKSYTGQTKGGEIVAQDEKNIAQQLRAEGFLVTSIVLVKEEETASSKGKFLDYFLSVPLKEKMVFARNLSIMVASGLTVSRALNNLAVQTENKTFKKILLIFMRKCKAEKLSVKAWKNMTKFLVNFSSIWSGWERRLETWMRF